VRLIKISAEPSGLGPLRDAFPDTPCEKVTPMTQPQTQHTPWQSGTPERILFATDLSCRCDRAMDRVVQLAEQWGARLLVMHVLEKAASDLPSWRQPASQEAVIAEQLRRDIAKGNIVFEVILGKGDPATAILQTAIARDCQLIVTGIARDETFGRAVLGTTVDALVRKSPIPVLVVKNRTHGAYFDVVVATDFSDASRHALECAISILPDARFVLFHAYRVPFSGFLDKQANQDAFHKLAMEECEAFMKRTAIPALIAPRLKTLLEFGSPDVLLGAYVQDQRADLVVLGTHGRSGLPGLLLGSVAEGLLQLLPCDMLVVREPKRADVPSAA